MSPAESGNILLNLISQSTNESVVSFTAGFPSQELFLVDEVKKAFNQVLLEPSSLQYSTDMRGFLPLREQIQQRLAEKKISATPDEVLLTTGSSQAIDLAARVYLSQEDVVLVENPTYQEVLRLFSLLGVKVIPVQSDENGIDPTDLVEKINAYKPKMVYVNPTFSNPTGETWSLERKKQLLEICHQHHVLILEDDPYGDLSFRDDEFIPTIFSLEKEMESSIVIYVSTFSKTIGPALRIGFAVAHESLLEPMIKAKALSDLQSSTLNQRAVSQLLNNISLDEHTRKMAHYYKSKMNLMIDILSDQLGEELNWVVPQGGIYLWVQFPSHIDQRTLLEKSVQEGVVYIPGEFFYVGTPDVNAIRFNFTYSSEEKIKEGISRFARAYQKSRSS